MTVCYKDVDGKETSRDCQYFTLDGSASPSNQIFTPFRDRFAQEWTSDGEVFSKRIFIVELN